MPDTHSSLPVDRKAREVRRGEIRGRLIAEAERQARIVGRSIVCGQYDQHVTCAGARHCLCECHDPAMSAADSQSGGAA